MIERRSGETHKKKALALARQGLVGQANGQDEALFHCAICCVTKALSEFSWPTMASIALYCLR